MNGTAPRAIAALALIAAIAGCARDEAPGTATAQSSPRQCFLPSQVQGYNAVGEDAVDVRLAAGEVYRLQLDGVCRQVDWTQQIGIRNLGAGSFVCGGNSAELIVPTPTLTQRCRVTNIRKLSADEIRASRD